MELEITVLEGGGRDHERSDLELFPISMPLRVVGSMALEVLPQVAALDLGPQQLHRSGVQVDPAVRREEEVVLKVASVKIVDTLAQCRLDGVDLRRNDGKDRGDLLVLHDRPTKLGVESNVLWPEVGRCWSIGLVRVL